MEDNKQDNTDSDELAVPSEYDSILPAGVVRRIRFAKGKLGMGVHVAVDSSGVPYVAEPSVIVTENGVETGRYAKIKIMGESELYIELMIAQKKRREWIETSAEVRVKKFSVLGQLTPKDQAEINTLNGIYNKSIDPDDESVEDEEGMVN